MQHPLFIKQLKKGDAGNKSMQMDSVLVDDEWLFVQVL